MGPPIFIPFYFSSTISLSSSLRSHQRKSLNHELLPTDGISKAATGATAGRPKQRASGAPGRRWARPRTEPSGAPERRRGRPRAEPGGAAASSSSRGAGRSGGAAGAAAPFSWSAPPSPPRSSLPLSSGTCGSYRLRRGTRSQNLLRVLEDSTWIADVAPNIRFLGARLNATSVCCKRPNKLSVYFSLFLIIQIIRILSWIK